VEAEPTEVEVHLRRATPRFDVVGLPDAAGREARDRVRSAIVASGYKFPSGALVVNLAPAGTPKVGAGHDLPIAVGILAAAGLIRRGRLENYLLFAELALDGRLRPVRGAFLVAATARARGFQGVVAAPGNGAEAALATRLPVYAPTSLAEAVLFLSGRGELEPVEPRPAGIAQGLARDFVEIKGQGSVKQAAVIAAAGAHNLLLIGPPGSGKTLTAERFPDLLPPLERAAALQVARIRSAAGLPIHDLPRRRPMRAPACTASSAGVLGGGNPPQPGEVSLAHHGVLFLDEFPHFRGDVLESLRQPLENGEVTLSRAGAHVSFPSRFQLIAAMNPCPCGHAGTSRCRCTPPVRARYVRKISGPLLDRIDLRVHVRAVPFKELQDEKPGASTAEMRAEVARARAAQSRRFNRTLGGAARTNATIRPGELDRWCRLDAAGLALLEDASRAGKITARGIARVRRVGRTIADLEGADQITSEYVLTAMGYRWDPED